MATISSAPVQSWNDFRAPALLRLRLSSEIMAQQASPPFLASFWNARFPGQISHRLVIAEKLTGNVIEKGAI